MDTYLAITIDTEVDSPRWKPEASLTLENIKAIPRLQGLFRKYGARPTYLLTYPVLANEEARAVFEDFLAKGEIEIGAHLHPWTNPPFASEDEKLKLSYPHRSKLEFEKLKVLTEAIKKHFGVKPVSYRAGRYGFDEESLGFLERTGYLVDTSITPNANWCFDGGPNFSNFKEINPYFLNKDNISMKGNSSVLEVPVSIVINRALPKPLDNLYKSSPFELKYLLKRTGMVKTVWLRPSIASFDEMKFAANSLMEKGINVLNMMFHSNELIPGKSPYVDTRQEAAEFFMKLEAIINYLVYTKGLKPATLFEIHNIFKSRKNS